MKKPKRKPTGSTILMMVAGILIILFIQATGIPDRIYIQEAAFSPKQQEPDTVILLRILAAGDAMAHLPQTQAAYDSDSVGYDFSNVFTFLRPRVSGFDLAMINLETPLAGEPYKGYPQFSAPDAYARDLKNLGFNLFCCANNHAVDQYNKGLLRTINVLDSLGIKHTGIYRDKVQRDTTYPLLLKIKGLRIALLNATYSTNGLVPKHPVKVNMIDFDELRADISKARLMEPDLLIAVMHWGGEYLRKPDSYQKRVAQFLADEGVDVIIGHHPHVVQPVEWITATIDSIEKQVLVVWSLGNFYSNQRQRYRDGGMFVTLDVAKSKVTGAVTIGNLMYDPFWVWKNDSPLQYRILTVANSDSLNQILNLPASHQKAFETFANDTREHMGTLLFRR